MDLVERARRRVAAARELRRLPLRWIASRATAAALPAGDLLRGLPVEHADIRWGLELICAKGVLSD